MARRSRDEERAPIARVARHARWRAGRVRAAAARLARRATAPLRYDPTFLILGASKAGTTTMYAALVQHPQIGAASKKEIQYFDFHFRRGRSWYRSHFPPQLSRCRAVGEATPYYLPHPLAPARVAHEYPRMRLVAILRDPVDRAHSHWAHEVELGSETLSFAEAIDREDERLAGETDRIRNEPGYISWPHFTFSYLARGRYLEQLEDWLAVFPREQLLVIRFEDLVDRPGEVFAETAEFLGAEPWAPATIAALNRREYEPMPDEMRERLAAYFEEPNSRLEAFLGRPLGWTRPSRRGA